MPSSYFKERKDAIYLFAAKQICKKYAPHPQSVIDVGSNQTPILEWFRDGQALDTPRLTSLDLRKPYEAPGIESVALDLMKYRPESIYDLVTCFQVMEHVPDPSSFGKKLLTLGKVIVVSVPYKWTKGSCEYHLHDPVTSTLLESWMGTSPKFKYIARELNKKERLIHVYQND
jgi:hypothetical protein